MEFSEEEIWEMLNACMDEVRGDSARDFIESLYDQYEERGKLTERQLIALQRFYDNI